MAQKGMIEFECPFCSRKIRTPPEYAGKQGKCTKCQQFVIVPTVKPPVVRRWGKRLAIVIASVFAVALLWLSCWKVFGTYRESFEGTSNSWITETYSNWTGKPCYRHVEMRDSGGKAIGYADGPVSDSGKPHGEWDLLFLDEFKSVKWWYWYGEQITEGEWHLRNQ